MTREETIDIEQQPSDDCVSRANLISKLEILERRYGSDFYWETRKIVDKLPSVKPQEQTGHWTRELIRNEKGGCIGAKMICSKCGNDNKHDEYMDYCPNCGAKMD